MAKKPGAGGIILLAVVLGVVTAYLIWAQLRQLENRTKENWQPVVVAAVDINPRTTITRNMLELRPLPAEIIAPDAIKNIEHVEGRITVSRIKAKEQVRQSDLAAEGQTVSLAYEVPPGMRAIAIGAGEIQAVGTAVKPGDRVDILATYTDPVNRQETTKTILQVVPVLAINKGQTDPSGKEGASSSLTVLVTPEQAELLAAADRQGALRVVLRPVQDDSRIDSPGVTVRDIRGGMPVEVIPKPAETGTATPVMISLPRSTERPREVIVYRGADGKTVPME